MRIPKETSLVAGGINTPTAMNFLLNFDFSYQILTLFQIFLNVF